MSAIVRPATPADAPAIHAIYRADTDDSPWSVADVCTEAVSRRLAAGYLTLVAEDSGGVVGHSDYVVGEEAGQFGKTIHLSVLQVHPGHRGRGAGRALVEHGLTLGRKHRCSWFTTQPGDDARAFYGRCGLQCVLEQADVEIQCRPMDHDLWERVPAVPMHVPARLPLRVGRAQSSCDMWNLCESDFGAGFVMQHTRARTAGGDAFLVLRSFERSSAEGPTAPPMLITWADTSRPLQDILSAAAGVAQSIGAASLRCIVPLPDLACVPGGFALVIRGRPDFWGIRLR